MSQPEAEAPASPGPLTSAERRVLGVLVEKAKTVPESYPLTVAALVAGCNQKSNRDPVTDYDADLTEEILERLRRKGAVVRVETGGRVQRWKHTLYDWLKVSKVELAVLAELLLRGSQTEGDLRARASRMEPLADLAALQTVLQGLEARGLVIQLSPPGQRRGVVVTHGLYPLEELERERRKYASGADTLDETDSPPTSRASAGGWVAEAAALREEIAALRATVEALTDEVNTLKSALGV